MTSELRNAQIIIVLFYHSSSADCQALLNAGNTKDGVYFIYPSQYPDSIEVYCDMTSGGWIVSNISSALCSVQWGGGGGA